MLVVFRVVIMIESLPFKSFFAVFALVDVSYNN